jgi:hypothetical protein
MGAIDNLEDKEDHHQYKVKYVFVVSSDEDYIPTPRFCAKFNLSGFIPGSLYS